MCTLLATTQNDATCGWCMQLSWLWVPLPWCAHCLPLHRMMPLVVDVCSWVDCGCLYLDVCPVNSSRKHSHRDRYTCHIAGQSQWHDRLCRHSRTGRRYEHRPHWTAVGLLYVTIKGSQTCDESASCRILSVDDINFCKQMTVCISPTGTASQGVAVTLMCAIHAFNMGEAKKHFAVGVGTNLLRLQVLDPTVTGILRQKCSRVWHFQTKKTLKNSGEEPTLPL